MNSAETNISTTLQNVSFLSTAAPNSALVIVDSVTLRNKTPDNNPMNMNAAEAENTAHRIAAVPNAVKVNILLFISIPNF